MPNLYSFFLSSRLKPIFTPAISTADKIKLIDEEIEEILEKIWQENALTSDINVKRQSLQQTYFGKFPKQNYLGKNEIVDNGLLNLYQNYQLLRLAIDTTELEEKIKKNLFNILLQEITISKVDVLDENLEVAKKFMPLTQSKFTEIANIVDTELNTFLCTQAQAILISFGRLVDLRNKLSNTLLEEQVTPTMHQHF